MKLVTFSLLAGFALSGCSLSSVEGRYKVVDAQWGDVHVVVKIDTQTGKTWRLVGPLANAQWVSIP